MFIFVTLLLRFCFFVLGRDVVEGGDAFLDQVAMEEKQL